MTTPRLFLGIFALALLLPLLLLACGGSDEPTDGTSQGGVAPSLQEQRDTANSDDAEHPSGPSCSATPIREVR